MSEGESHTEPRSEPKWRPIGRIHRRVLGVLVEKAKTTPDAYPLTLNSLTNGCNQKSNRDPQMNLNPDDVENAVEQLRHLSAVIEVSGGGRVPKYRHLMYEWLGVDKTEAAVMTELLLRGAQTVGELRGRAARMEPIADVRALQPILDTLASKGLVVSLTPPGRGQIVSHALYLPEEMEKVKTSAAQCAAGSVPSSPPSFNPPANTPPTVGSTASAPLSDGSPEIQRLRAEIDQLKSDVARLKSDVQDLWDNLNG